MREQTEIGYKIMTQMTEKSLGLTCKKAKRDKWCRELLGNSQKRSSEKGMKFNLTVEFLIRLWNRQDGKCAVSGIYFMESDLKITNGRRPFVPSIDRIDASKGYTRDNVRLVCSIVNYAMMTWGLDVLDFLVRNRARQMVLLGHTEVPRSISRLASALDHNAEALKLGGALGVGHTEIALNLPRSWFWMRKQAGLPVPLPVRERQTKKMVLNYYDLDECKKWFLQNPDAYDWCPEGSHLVEIECLADGRRERRFSRR